MRSGDFGSLMIQIIRRPTQAALTFG